MYSEESYHYLTTRVSPFQICVSVNPNFSIWELLYLLYAPAINSVILEKYMYF